MQKPIIVARQEFTENVVKTVNASGLPAFVMKGILEQVIKQLEILEERQEKEAADAWQEYLKQEEEKTKEAEEVNNCDES